MKLIDLLVNELPKRGGWPDGADIASQRENGVIEFLGLIGSSSCRGECWVAGTIKSIMIDELGAGYANTIITKEEYEKALQESKPKVIGKMIPADGNSWPEFEFVSITPTESLSGSHCYIGHKTHGSAYLCYGKYWIPEMYEQKSDNGKLNDSIERAENNFIDAAAKLVVAKLVEKAIKEVYAAGESLKNNAINTKTNEAPISRAYGVDFVNHPPHYQSDNGIECIDAIRAALGKDGFIAYCRGNAIKYSWRAAQKGNESQDYAKASWYLGKAQDETEKE